jgi:hypothetical protein
MMAEELSIVFPELPEHTDEYVKTFQGRSHLYLLSHRLLVFLLCFLAAAPMALASSDRDQTKLFDVKPKVGNGYLELPTGDNIVEVYKKDGDFAFGVVGHGKSFKDVRDTSRYIIDFHGHVLWSANIDHYVDPLTVLAIRQSDVFMQATGWIIKNPSSPFFMASGAYAALKTRSLSDMPYPDSDFLLFNQYLETGDKNVPSNQIIFFRLLQISELLNKCDRRGIGRMAKCYQYISRLPEPARMMEFYPIDDNKTLVTDATVAILIKPNLRYYADHPDDYYTMPVSEALSIESNTLNDEEREEGKPYEPLIDDLVNELDGYIASHPETKTGVQK